MKLIKQTKPAGSFRRINQCFLFLGADRSEVYYPSHSRPWSDINGSSRTIYDRYPADVLYSWAKDLYRQCIVMYHPDKNPADKEYCTQLCCCFSEAFQFIKRVLTRRGLNP